MAELQWIKTLLFLILMLQFPAKASGKYVYITVRDGDDVTLPCGNVRDDQDKCSNTDWLFDRPQYTRAVVLVRHGHVDNREISRSKSDRLSVTENCSVVVEKVTVEDAGRYSCRLYNTSGHEQGEDAVVRLFVVIMTNHHGDVDTVNCSVSAFNECRHTVKWFYEGKAVSDVKHMRSWQSDCSASVSFMNSSLECEVTHVTSGEGKRFPFKPQSADYRASATTSPANVRINSLRTLNSTGQAQTDCSALNFIILMMHVVEILLLTVIVVLLIRAQCCVF
ncbi:uncharacterized protein LOC113149053 [Anabas testudineus]|uniref:uncharacterized protein LOC113149053 n=1 Tax=Anabas testudineus TaxID=64144 RepID=UPI000E45D0A1|nr:uncharacterized protein LOC113149053 [Anabas testudineus]